MRVPTQDERLDRQHLLNYNRADAIRFYANGKAEGMQDPVVLVMDLRDKLAYGIQSLLMDRAEVDRHIAEYLAVPCIPTVTVALPIRGALKLLSSVSASSRRVMETPPPPGSFLAVVIAGEGIGFFYLPQPATLAAPLC